MPIFRNFPRRSARHYWYICNENCGSIRLLLFLFRSSISVPEVYCEVNFRPPARSLHWWWRRIMLPGSGYKRSDWTFFLTSNSGKPVARNVFLIILVDFTCFFRRLDGARFLGDCDFAVLSGDWHRWPVKPPCLRYCGTYFPHCKGKELTRGHVWNLAGFHLGVGQQLLIPKMDCWICINWFNLILHCHTHVKTSESEPSLRTLGPGMYIDR